MIRQLIEKAKYKINLKLFSLRLKYSYPLKYEIVGIFQKDLTYEITVKFGIMDKNKAKSLMKYLHNLYRKDIKDLRRRGRMKNRKQLIHNPKYEYIRDYPLEVTLEQTDLVQLYATIIYNKPKWLLGQQRIFKERKEHFKDLPNLSNNELMQLKRMIQTDIKGNIQKLNRCFVEMTLRNMEL